MRGFYFNKTTNNGLKIEDDYQLSYIFDISDIELSEFDSIVENEDFVLCFNEINDILILLKDEKNNIKQAILKTLFKKEVKLNEVDNYVQFLKLYEQIEDLKKKIVKIININPNKNDCVANLQKELESLKLAIYSYKDNLSFDIKAITRELIVVEDKNKENINHLHKHIESKFILLENSFKEASEKLVKIEEIILTNSNKQEFENIKKELLEKMDDSSKQIFDLMQNFNRIQDDIEHKINECKNELKSEIEKNNQNLDTLSQSIDKIQDNIKDLSVSCKEKEELLSLFDSSEKKFQKIDAQIGEIFDVFNKKINFSNILFIYVKNKTKFALIKEVEFNKKTNVLFYSIKRVEINLETTNKNILNYNYKDLYFYVSDDFNIKILENYSDIQSDIKIINNLIKTNKKNSSVFFNLMILFFVFIVGLGAVYFNNQNEFDQNKDVPSQNQIMEINKKVTKIEEGQKQILLKIEATTKNKIKESSKENKEKSSKDDVNILLNKIEE